MCGTLTGDHVRFLRVDDVRRRGRRARRRERGRGRGGGDRRRGRCRRSGRQSSGRRGQLLLLLQMELLLLLLLDELQLLGRHRGRCGGIRCRRGRRRCLLRLMVAEQLLNKSVKRMSKPSVTRL